MIRAGEGNELAKLLQGKAVAEALNTRLIERVHALSAKGVVPRLALVRCGDDPSDLAYERGAMARAQAIGVGVEQIILPADVTREELIHRLHVLNADDTIHGVLLFRPLPRHLRGDSTEICNALDPAKDVDCMTDLSNAGVYEGRDDLGFAPCTAQACMELIDHYGIDPCGKRAVVIGRSLVVGRPAAMMLMRKNATVTICHTRTVDVPRLAREADILISAAGKLGSLTAEYVRPGQTVIDVSVNWDPDKPNAKGERGGYAGDAVFEDVARVVDAITPVPGGVGSVTTSVLIGHVIEAAERALRPKYN